MPDIRSDSNAWVDVYAESGIAPGTPINIQNKAFSPATVQEADSLPTATSRDGLLLQYGLDTGNDGSKRLYMRTNGGTFAHVWLQ